MGAILNSLKVKFGKYVLKTMLWHGDLKKYLQNCLSQTGRATSVQAPCDFILVVKEKGFLFIKRIFKGS